MSEQPSAPPSFLKLMVKSVAGHLGAGIATSLVGLGALSNSQATEFTDVIGALAVYGLTLWWTAAQHKKAATGPKS